MIRLCYNFYLQFTLLQAKPIIKKLTWYFFIGYSYSFTWKTSLNSHLFLEYFKLNEDTSVSKLGRISASVLERMCLQKWFLEVKGALNMCPLEGAPRFLQNPGLLSLFSLGTGCYDTGLGLQTLWKEKFKCPELKFRKKVLGSKTDNYFTVFQLCI